MMKHIALFTLILVSLFIIANNGAAQENPAMRQTQEGKIPPTSLEIPVDPQKIDVVIEDISFLDLNREPLNRDPVAGEPIYIVAKIKNNGYRDAYLKQIGIKAETTHITPPDTLPSGYYIKEMGEDISSGKTIQKLKPGETSHMEALWNSTPAINEQIVVTIKWNTIDGEFNNVKIKNVTVRRNVQDCQFDISRDAYSFKNYPYYEVIDGDLNSIQNSITTNNLLSFIFSGINFAADKSDLFYAVISNSGHCYGIASTSILYYTGDLTKPIIDSKKETIFDQSKENIGIMKGISLYQRLQILGLINTLGYGPIHTKTPSLNDAFASIKKSLSNDRPIILTMWKRDSSDSHSVVVMDYYERTDDPNLKNIVIYNSNFPGIARIVEFDLKLNKVRYDDLYYDYDRVLVEEPISLSQRKKEIIEPSKTGKNGQIISVVWPSKDTYDRTEPVPVEVIFKNTGSEPHSFWVGYSVQDSSGKWWDATARQAWVTLPGESGSIELEWKPPETVPEGAFTAKVALWDGPNFDTCLMEGEFNSRTKDNAFKLNPIQVPGVPQGKVLGGWNRTFGGSENELGRSVQQTNDGGYIITGDTKSYGAGNNDIWLVKTDANGNKLWDKTFGGPEDDYGRSVQQITDGGYIITGYTKSYGAGKEDVWLIKIDSSGIIEWDKTFGGPGTDRGLSVQQTNEGGYIIAGDTYSYGAGSDDAWLIKTDANGNKLWDKTFGESHDDGLYSVQQTSDGGYIIAGYTDSYFHENHDLLNLWLIRVDKNGDQIWTKTLPSEAAYPISLAYSVQQTSDNGCIVIGYEGGASLWPPDSTGIWLIKMDKDGNIIWSRNDFGGSSKGSWDNIGYSVQQTSDGGYILVGSTPSYAPFLSSSNFSGVLIKTDSDGGTTWKKSFENSMDNILRSVRQTADGGYIAVGSTNHTDAGGFDIWLVKTDANGNE